MHCARFLKNMRVWDNVLQFSTQKLVTSLTPRFQKNTYRAICDSRKYRVTGAGFVAGNLKEFSEAISYISLVTHGINICIQDGEHSRNQVFPMLCNSRRTIGTAANFRSVEYVFNN